MSTSYQKGKNKTPVEIISHHYGTCQKVCMCILGLCLREARSTSLQRAGPPDVLFWNMMALLVLHLVPRDFQKERKFSLSILLK